jgi:RNA polymerase sigma-70 factor (ECF subfamily)
MHTGAARALDVRPHTGRGARNTMTESELSGLHARYSGILFNLAISVTRDFADAEEVVGDTFAKAWADSAGFDESRGSRLAWLMMLTRSRALDAVRSRTRRQRVLDRAEVEFSVDDECWLVPAEAAESLEAAELRDVLARALGTLPTTQREVLELAFFHETSHAGVAERLGVPLGTVKTRARLGLRKMRAVLEMR